VIDGRRSRRLKRESERRGTLGEFALELVTVQRKTMKRTRRSSALGGEEAVDLWLERSHLASNPSAPLFPSFGKNRETIEFASDRVFFRNYRVLRLRK
jgi:hypothetical protein